MKKKTEEFAFDGARLQALRDARGWTVRELARRAKLSAPTILRAEGGDSPNTTSLLAIVRALGVPMGDLMRQNGKPVRDDREYSLALMKVRRIQGAGGEDWKLLKKTLDALVRR